MSTESDSNVGKPEQAVASASQTPKEVNVEELKALCAEHVCKECPEAHKIRDEKLRALAEAENYKKRLEREKEDFLKFASEGVLEDLLPVLDNLDLALLHAGSNEACKSLIQGVEMTRKIFQDTLKKHGLEAVGAAGEEFDPNLHQAIGQEENRSFPSGTVTRLFQSGYVLKGRLLRPAKVMVNKTLEKSV